MNKEYLCPDCGKERKPCAVRCVSCSNDFIHKKAREKTAEKTRIKESIVKDKNVKCKACNIMFFTKSTDRWCSTICEPIVRTMEINERWIDRPYVEGPSKYLINAKLERKRLYEDDHGFFNKFNSCRG